MEFLTKGNIFIYMLRDTVLNKLISDKEVLDLKLYTYINKPLSIESQVEDIIKTYKELVVIESTINKWKLFLEDIDNG